MDILGREKLHHLSEHILDECESLFFSYAKDLIRYAPFLPNLIRTAGTAEFRVSSDSSLHMSRKVNLRNDGDTLRCRIGNDLLELSLGVVSAIRDAIVVRALADEGTLSPATHLGKERIFLNLDSPTLVVGKVPVKGIELVKLHHIKIFADLISREEMA